MLSSIHETLDFGVPGADTCIVTCVVAWSFSAASGRITLAGSTKLKQELKLLKVQVETIAGT